MHATVLWQNPGSQGTDTSNRNLQEALCSLFNENPYQVNFIAGYASASGLEPLKEPILAFARKGNLFRMVIGTDFGNGHEQMFRDSVEQFMAFQNLVPDRIQIRAFTHSVSGENLHSKMYMFRYPDYVKVIIGSGNLTRHGMTRNHELSVGLRLEREGDRADIIDLYKIWRRYWYASVWADRLPRNGNGNGRSVPTANGSRT